MEFSRNSFLIAGAICSALAAALHIACIIFGAPLYRFVGAGEKMARMAATGHWYPNFAASVIALMLLIWSAYALSGAGVILKLPFLRLVLCIITGIYLLRGIAFVSIMKYFPGNSMLFWYLSSAICFTFGLIHLLGIRQVWARL